MTNSKLTAAALVATFATIATPVFADPDFGFTAAPPATPHEGPKSEDAAQLLAIAGSLAGPAIMIAGSQLQNVNASNGLMIAGGVVAVVAPSAGDWSTGQVGVAGMLVRGVGAAMVAEGLREGPASGGSLFPSATVAMATAAMPPRVMAACPSCCSAVRSSSVARSTTSFTRATRRTSTTTIITSMCRWRR